SSPSARATGWSAGKGPRLVSHASLLSPSPHSFCLLPCIRFASFHLRVSPSLSPSLVLSLLQMYRWHSLQGASCPSSLSRLPSPSLYCSIPLSPSLSPSPPPLPAVEVPLAAYRVPHAPLLSHASLLPPPESVVFASAGDSLSYFNFIPSLLCQIHQASPVNSIPVPARLAPLTSLVYHVPEYNVTIVNTWSTFLNQCWQDKQTLSLYNNGRPVTPEDSVVNLEGVDWRWGRYLAKAGMQSVKKLVDRANDKVTRGTAAAGDKWPVVFFLSAPTKQSGCAASFEPRTEGEGFRTPGLQWYLEPCFKSADWSD
ncbi:unnamed protein product, partial [Closterium sp. NIES-54]